MKSTKLSFFLAAILAIPFLVSCGSDDENTDVLKNLGNGVIVLNQGKDKANNASFSYYDFDSKVTYVDYFSSRNNRGLGDTGQDMIKYGSKVYIAVSASSLVEVVDAKTGASKKTISMLTGGVPATPRSLTASNGKVYAVLFDGHVAQIDTTTFAVEKTISVGANPEQSVIVNNKLYVANSGGISMVADSTISVIDLSTFKEVSKIKVVINPVVLKADKYGDLYVISMGNYYNIPYTLQRINIASGTVTKITDVKAYNMTIDDDYAYIYHYDYDANYKVVNKSYTIYDVKNEKVYKTNFIASDAVAKTPFSIDVNPITKDVYIGETDYVNTGKMYCFGTDGILKFSFETGVNPAKTLFITNK